ncbi:MAG TPA: polyprenyl diphosphate synthase [Patescibacteria group bacterium]|nr:polyprenyl diphosphate synthase [Patescibacteria group bacterium]
MTENQSIQTPEHVAIILDGNRRWARERGLSSIKGHYQGKQAANQVAEGLLKKGVKIVSLYVFSSENWNRKKEEVDYLMKLLRETIDNEIKKLSEKQCRVVISGRIRELPGDLPDKCRELMEKSRDYTKGVINFCLNYGGRKELVDAFQGMLADNVSPEEVSEDKIAQYLYNPENIKDPDVIVRTSGEKRLSGFQLWRSAYSELIFLDKYWPEMESGDADNIISEYSRRQRRFGG